MKLLLSTALILCSTWNVSAGAPIEQLVFKGTHNSYACKAGGIHTLPVMAHPPKEQLDDFGVWNLEFDFDVVARRDNERLGVAVVGHDSGDDDATCWGRTLRDFLKSVKESLSFKYRPVFLMLEKKDWNDSGTRWSVAGGIAIAVQELESAFGKDNVISLKQFVDEGRTIPENAGKIIWYSANSPRPEAERMGYDPRVPDFNSDKCISKEKVFVRIRDGQRLIRLDQYQADWTFEYGVPPNPIVVNSESKNETVLPESQLPFIGTSLSPDGANMIETCEGSYLAGTAALTVHQQGTFRFPFNSLRKAVSRADGRTGLTAVDNSTRGDGWTVLMKPGIYRETILIRIPLILRKDDRLPGTVVIGCPACPIPPPVG